MSVIPWLGIVIDALSLLYYGVLTVFFTTAYLLVTVAQYIPTLLQYVATIFKFVVLPISALWRIVLFVSAPVTYTVRFVFSPLFMLLGNIQRLAPLYIYFATAISIGVLTALVVHLITSTTFSLFNLRDTSTTSTKNPTTTTKRHTPSAPTPNRPASPSSSIRGGAGSDDFDTSSLTTDLDALFAGISSSADSDTHQFLAALQGGGGGGWRDPANTKRKRRSVGGGGGGLGVGLTGGRFGTILEEDDDSL